MTSPPESPQPKNLGDWLILRSTGVLGDFRMPECIRIIQTEGRKDHWINMITNPDIVRILARYKEHVSYWNISMETIQSELNSLTQALDLNHNYFEIATLFDSVPAKRIPPAPYGS